MVPSILPSWLKDQSVKIAFYILWNVGFDVNGCLKLIGGVQGFRLKIVAQPTPSKDEVSSLLFGDFSKSSYEKHN
jgi:hypothetical protein